MAKNDHITGAILADMEREDQIILLIDEARYSWQDCLSAESYAAAQRFANLQNDLLQELHALRESQGGLGRSTLTDEQILNQIILPAVAAMPHSHAESILRACALRCAVTIPQLHSVAAVAT